MTDSLRIFGIILAGNGVLVLLYLVGVMLMKRTESKVKSIICAILMLLCPVAGALFLIISEGLYLIFFSEPVDLEGVVFSKERVKIMVHADEESERNMVPLEEAIEITSQEELRNLMVNIVRGDIKKSLSAISLALSSSDSETAHYAASVLQDALNEFRTIVQKDYEQMQKEPENKTVYAGILIDYMNQVLAQKVLTDVEQSYYVKVMEQVCESLYETDKEKLTGNQYEAIAIRLLEMKDYEKCEKWCKRASYQYPNTLSVYTCQLKLYFSSGQKERFFEVMNELKRSSVVIDKETLELIRVFQE